MDSLSLVSKSVLIKMVYGHTLLHYTNTGTTLWSNVENALTLFLNEQLAESNNLNFNHKNGEKVTN